MYFDYADILRKFVLIPSEQGKVLNGSTLELLINQWATDTLIGY